VKGKNQPRRKAEGEKRRKGEKGEGEIFVNNPGRLSLKFKVINQKIVSPFPFLKMIWNPRLKI